MSYLSPPSSAHTPPLRFSKLPEFTGAALLLLGVTVMTGWLLQVRALVEFIPGHGGMVFSTALCFALLGAALLLPALRPLLYRRAQQALGAAVVALAVLALIEHATGMEWSMSRAVGHAWLSDLNARTGLMAPNTAFGFIVSGLSLVLLRRVRATWQGGVVLLFIYLTLLNGLFGLLSYNARLDFLYQWYHATRMSLYTGVGFLLLSAALWRLSARQDWYQALFRDKADVRINLASSAVLITLGLAAMFAGLAVTQPLLRRTAEDKLNVALHDRAQMITRAVERAVVDGWMLNRRHLTLGELRKAVENDDPVALGKLRYEAEDLLITGYTGVAFEDLRGRELARAGRFISHPAFDVALNDAGRRLLWNQKTMLREHVALSDAQGHIGWVWLERPLPDVEWVLTDMSGLGRTAEVEICAADNGAGLRCLPTHRITRPFSMARDTEGYAAMVAGALRGERGVVVTLDPLRYYVLAAYGPVGALPLGMTVKLDSDELYAPLREQFEVVLVLLLGLIGGAAMLRRWQIAPLVRQVVRSEQALQRANQELERRVQERTMSLRESEQRYRSLIETIPQLAWVTNAKGTKALYFNQRWYSYTGQTAAQAKGTGWTAALHPDHVALTLQRWRECVRGGIPYEMEYLLKRHDGVYRWHLVLAMPLRNQYGAVSGWIGTCTDIEDRKRAAENLREFTKELEQRVRERTLELETANEELEAFSYSVSHDLRAPLRSIDGFSHALVEEYAHSLDEQGRDYLRRIRAASQRMAQLIDDLLALSRYTRQPMRRSMVNLSRLAADIVRDLQSHAPSRAVQVTIDPDLHAYGDASLLEAVLQNLLDNAWKFTSKTEHPIIEFGALHQGDERIYYVRDNGAGFDMRHADKLFGAFQRLHAERDFPGTGIGLALVQRILHRHGGRIWAEAQPGQGATFYFTVPNAFENLETPI